MRFRNNSEQFGKLKVILLKPGVIHRQLCEADTLPSSVYLPLLLLFLVCPIIMYPNNDNSSVLIQALKAASNSGAYCHEMVSRGLPL